MNEYLEDNWNFNIFNIFNMFFVKKKLYKDMYVQFIIYSSYIMGSGSIVYYFFLLIELQREIIYSIMKNLRV